MANKKSQKKVKKAVRKTVSAQKGKSEKFGKLKRVSFEAHALGFPMLIL